MKIVAGIVSALVLSNLALAVMVMQRQDDATERLAKLESAVEKSRKGVDDLASKQENVDRRIDQLAETRRDSAAPAPGHAAPPAPPVSSRPSAPEAFRSVDPAAPAATPLSDAQREAVKREVDEAVKKKLGHMPDMEAMNDPLGTMEKELSLNAWQKDRIKALMDELEAEQTKFITDAFDPKNPDKFDFAKLNDIAAIHKKYDEKVVQELDANQQAKYADLKRQGKLPTLGGGNVRFQFSSSSSDGK